MKHFLYSIRRRMAMRKAKRTGKLVKLPDSPDVKKGKTYPLWVQIKPIDFDDPKYIKMCEEARKSLEEGLPDHLHKRIFGEEKRQGRQ